MQTYEVVVTETAENEIDEYLGFIADDSLENAIGWYNNIYDKISTLSELAPRCPILRMRVPTLNLRFVVC